MNKHPASFRDPSGFLFEREDRLFRQINRDYRSDYDVLMDSGLYERLADEGLLVSHREVSVEPADPDCAYKIISPDIIHFISYPYEWCFDALRDAALLTLKIHEIALDYGMMLKDATAFNVQFTCGRPVFIDTLSFEQYTEGQPWPAYRQFCRHFLAPLALMSSVDIGLGRLFQTNVDGVPLQLASSSLPFLSRLSIPILLHLHMHAAGEKRWADSEDPADSRGVSKRSMKGLIDSLRSAVLKQRWEPEGHWQDYYHDNSYTEEGLAEKRRLVEQYIKCSEPGCVWDLGSNVGVFSHLIADGQRRVVSVDSDPACVQLNYRKVVEEECEVLPLCVDLCNPSPAVGWQNQERDSLLERGPADAVLALALVHHLAISNNVPLDRLADFMAACTGGHLVIEFVPKSDQQVQRLLASREDIFEDYTQRSFEAAFSEKFSIERQDKIADSERILYMMRRIR